MRERGLKMKVILQLLIKCQCCPHIELAFSGFRNTEADQTKGVPSLKKHGKTSGTGLFLSKITKKIGVIILLYSEKEFQRGLFPRNLESFPEYQLENQLLLFTKSSISLLIFLVFTAEIP